MSERFLGYGRQNIDRDDIDAVVRTLQSDWLTQGPAVERFEAALAERCGAKHAVAVSSGGAALHVATLAAGVECGDFGLTSAITFAASANCLMYTGAGAGFVDIDPQTLGMSPQALQRSLAASPETKIVIPVHMGGLPHAIADIKAAAGGRTIVEDGAHSLGATYPDEKPVGSCAHSAMTVLSFHPVKIITSGEGGAVLTNDAELARRARLLRSYGIERNAERFVGSDTQEDGRPKPWLGEQQMLGFNYRMSDIQAALGLSQLSKLDRFLRRRREIAARYDDAFGKLKAVRLPQSSAEQRARSGLHLYILLIDFAALKTTRTAFMAELAKSGIGSQVHYAPVYHHPYVEKLRPVDRKQFPEAERYYSACLSTPLHSGLTDEEVERVVAAVTKAAQPQ